MDHQTKLWELGTAVAKAACESPNGTLAAVRSMGVTEPFVLGGVVLRRVDATDDIPDDEANWALTVTMVSDSPGAMVPSFESKYTFDLPDAATWSDALDRLHARACPAPAPVEVYENVTPLPVGVIVVPEQKLRDAMSACFGGALSLGRNAGTRLRPARELWEKSVARAALDHLVEECRVGPKAGGDNDQ